MRISTLSFYNTTLGGIQNQQSQIARLSQQIATEQKYLATKDAPIETSRALQLVEGIAVRTQYQANQIKADLSLKQESLIVGELDNALTSARSAALDINIDQDQESREVIAIQLANLYKHIKDLANSKDSGGNYIFAGHESDTRPYVHNSVYDGAVAPQTTTYLGDTGVRQAEIEAQRTLQTSDNLNTVLGAGTANDVLQAIDSLAAGLRAGTATQTDLSNFETLMNGAQSTLRVMQASLAGRSVELAETQATTASLLTVDLDALSSIQDIDKAAAIIELQQRQIALQAAQSTFVLTSKQSLFSYL
jgi:flagellar hook-associated protein 3 FlgL